jgi:hypothetical protein
MKKFTIKKSIFKNTSLIVDTRDQVPGKNYVIWLTVPSKQSRTICKVLNEAYELGRYDEFEESNRQASKTMERLGI